MIFSECLSNHYKMINEMKGIPGIRADRFQEAFNVRHCALSLVGEPILVSLIYINMIKIYFTIFYLLHILLVSTYQ